MPKEFFTIGHSTHTLERFIELLASHEIKLLADIRRFPGSRRHPHFSRESLAGELPKIGMEYQWFESLGGRRGKLQAESENLGLRNASFRNYADYMQTAEFETALAELLAAAEDKRTAYMCAEGLYWQCHRRLVSDYLLATKGLPVQHIMPSGELRPHALTAGAIVTNGHLSYPSPAGRQMQIGFE
jgi:uncharacterized protein (DUF488 family)